MERKLTRAECEEFLRSVKPLLEAIYDSVANPLWAFLDQIMKDPNMRSALREHPDLKRLFDDA
jgi:hypothetical protein